MNKEYTVAESTNKLLMVIIALLVKENQLDQRNMREQIFLLSDIGLRPVEIAEILGRSRVYVTKELSKKSKGKTTGRN